LTGNPYVGLAAFKGSDAPYYFGRDVDARLLVTNFYGSPTTVVYGRAGVGKTSLIHAAVIPRLEAKGVPVVTFDQWGAADLVEALRRRVVESIPVSGEPSQHEASLADAVQNRSGHVPMLIVLDNFEDYFIYHDVNEQSGGAFAHTVGGIVDDATATAHVFFVVREDAVGRLPALQVAIPSVMRNLIAIDDLTADMVREAIARPLEHFNRLNGTSYGIEPALVDEIIRSLSTATTEGAVSRGRVDLPFLQLVLHRLWELERQSGGLILRRATLAAAGNVRGLFDQSVFDTIAALPEIDQMRIATFIGYLVTPSGVRIAQTESDLAIFADCPLEDVRRLIDVLADQRIVSISKAAGEGGRSCRVTYDQISGALLDWRRRFVAGRELAELRRKEALRRRILVTRFAVTGTIGVLLLAALLYAVLT
jgi:hypothetical protein